MDAQAAVTPAGSPVAVPIPVAPVVVCVIFVNTVLIQRVGVEEAVPTVHVEPHAAKVTQVPPAGWKPTVDGSVSVPLFRIVAMVTGPDLISSRVVIQGPYQLHGAVRFVAPVLWIANKVLPGRSV